MWIVFFTIFTAAIFIISEQTLPFLTSWHFKLPYLCFYLLFLWLIYTTIMQLHRVEMGADCYYVSNYFKTYRLIYEDIDHIRTIPLGRLMYVTIVLKDKSSLGKKITFLASKNLLELFLKSEPKAGEKIKSLMMSDQ